MTVVQGNLGWLTCFQILKLRNTDLARVGFGARLCTVCTAGLGLLVCVAGSEATAELSEPVPQPDVRSLLENILPPTPDRPTTAELIKQVSDRRRYPRMDTRHYPRNDPVHWLFLALDPDAVELFRPLLESKNEFLRAAACLYLGRIGDQASFDRIVQLTKDKSHQVRRLALGALGSIGRPEGIGHIIRRRDDPNGDVRYAIPFALGAIPGNQATEAMADHYLFLLDSTASLSRHNILERLRYDLFEKFRLD